LFCLSVKSAVGFEVANDQQPTTNDWFFMPFACIFVPDFPVEAILRAEPELRSQPVAVLEGKPPLEKIISVNQAAREAGISPKMTKLQIESCGEIALRDRSEFQESAAHNALLDCAQSFSPRVEDAAVDTVLLDLSGLDKLFGPLPKIAREIFRRASEMGLRTNVSVASTLDAALLAAHGFSEVAVLPEGKESEILGGLPVGRLFADEKESDDKEEILETLHRWGIQKFRDLAALPEIALSERLGQRGLELQRKAYGTSHRALVPSDPPLVFEEATEPEFPLVLLEPLAFLLNRMLDQLCARLKSRSLAAQEIHLKMALENGRQQDSESTLFQRAIHLPVPLLDAKTFLKLLQLDLKAHPPGAPVTKVHLRIEPAKPRPGQNGLFIPRTPEPEKLELTLAKISAVVGGGRAGSPQILNTHRPQAFEMQRFMPLDSARAGTPVPPQFMCAGGTGAGLERSRRVLARTSFPSINESNTPSNLVTALRLFRPPVPVTMNHQDGKPSHISSHKRNQISGEVLWAGGPWRSSGDWWEQDAWVRDEWDIAVQEKTGIVFYRLVHDLMEGRWLLEGSYD
jgi:protein ImuB